MQSFQELEKTLSEERLAPFRRSPEEREADVIARYLWNIALSESLYPALHLVEVSLRNRINDAASQSWGPGWLRDTRVLLGPEIKKVNEAIASLARDGKSDEKGRIIAELPFGFWTSLFRRDYEQRLFNKVVKATFFHLDPSLRTRSVISGRLDSIRRLRNRVFHYEPIWRYDNLSERHQWLGESIKWICPEAATLLRKMDRFDSIFKAGSQNFDPNRN
jgi:hypothetical protein